MPQQNPLILTSTETISESFAIPWRALVRLEGTINAEWNVQSRRAEDNTADWINEGTPRPSSKRQEIVVGVDGLIYRINLGTGNEGPTGYAYLSRTLNWR